jgi:DNA-binding CsgD family transcriptional regulator
MNTNGSGEQTKKSVRLMSALSCKSHAGGPKNSRPAIDGEPQREDIEKLVALGLTCRQAEVAFWIAQGKTNDELAIILNISRHTIPHHVEAILARLHLVTRTEIMLCALETLGWLRWPERRVKRKTARSKR